MRWTYKEVGRDITETISGRNARNLPQKSGRMLASAQTYTTQAHAASMAVQLPACGGGG